MLMLDGLMGFHDLQVLYRRPDNLSTRISYPRGYGLRIGQLHIAQTHQVYSLARMSCDYALYLGVGRLDRLKLVVMLLLVVLLRSLRHLLNVNRLMLLMVLLVVRFLGHMLNDVMGMYDCRTRVRMVCGNCCGRRYNLFNVDKFWNWKKVQKVLLVKIIIHNTIQYNRLLTYFIFNLTLRKL